MASLLTLNSAAGNVVKGEAFGGSINSQPGTGQGALFMEFSNDAGGPWVTSRELAGGGEPGTQRRQGEGKKNN